MNEREKIIAAYVCSNEKLPDKRCEKCPFGYEYLDQTGDNYFVGCNTERMMVDAIDLLKAQEPAIPLLDETGIFYCANCKKQAVGYKNYAGVVFRHNLYCPLCGKAVKWDA